MVFLLGGVREERVSCRSQGGGSNFVGDGVARWACLRHRCGVEVVELTVEGGYRRWGDDLHRYATALVGPFEAEDVVADAVVGLLSSGRLVTASDPKAYMFGAVHNSVRMRLRAEGRRRAREWRVSDDPSTSDAEIDPSVRAAVAVLSLQQRAVIYLTYWEDLTPPAVAAWLEVSEGTVRRQLARARARLRKLLHD